MTGTDTEADLRRDAEASVAPGSQNGRIFLVTDGNPGIDFGLCKLLYRAGGTVYMASRSEHWLLVEDQSRGAIKSIIDEVISTGGTLTFLPLDLSDLESVKSAAESFAQQQFKLDVLWNSAGGGCYRAGTDVPTVQGFEPMIGVHCIATLLLPTFLLPQLRAAALAEREIRGSFGGRTRVLWMSSGMADTSTPRNGINFDELEGKNLIQNYAVSKTGAWFLGREFARRHSSEDILSLPVNPGNLKTNSWEGTPALLMWFFNTFMLYEPIYGTYTLLFARLSPDLAMEHSGIHIIPWGRVRPDSEIKPRRDLLIAMTPVEEGGLGYATKLWEWCEAKWKPYV
ncbi:NAD(P)-binding protein [Thozetella sp. PMI_491]|nr:NAD(P)-binding protein [Thozetella sp. PMI_491]